MPVLSRNDKCGLFTYALMSHFKHEIPCQSVQSNPWNDFSPKWPIFMWRNSTQLSHTQSQWMSVDHCNYNREKIQTIRPQTSTRIWLNCFYYVPSLEPASVFSIQPFETTYCSSCSRDDWMTVELKWSQIIHTLLERLRVLLTDVSVQ